MQNDVLGFVDNAHLAWSDYYEQGPFHPNCLKLSGIHSVSFLTVTQYTDQAYQVDCVSYVARLKLIVLTKGSVDFAKSKLACSRMVVRS